MEIDIIAGFTGAGKTSFLNGYLPILKGRNVVILNEFGEVALAEEMFQADGAVRRLSEGCVCCTLALELLKVLRETAQLYQPDRILVELDGVGKISDVVRTLRLAKRREKLDIQVGKLITVVDASVFEDFLEDFGDFYREQIESAGGLLLSHLEEAEGTERIVKSLRDHNPRAIICTRDFRSMNKEELLELMSRIPDCEALLPGTKTGRETAHIPMVRRGVLGEAKRSRSAEGRENEI